MIQKIQISLLMLFALGVVIVGGYNCSSRQVRNTTPFNLSDKFGSKTGTIADSTANPNSTINSSKTNYDYETRDNVNLPTENTNNCRREQYSDLEDKHGAAGPLLDVSNSRIREYRLGRDTNFGVKCARVYLNLSKIDEDEKYYEGELTISYEADGKVNANTFRTGRKESENLHNYWTGGSIRSAEFYSIFEDSKGSVIFFIDEIREREIHDGETQRLAEGEVWFKIFRGFSGNRNDVCYQEGLYVDQLRQVPPRPSAPCWLVPFGPYSCSPKGISGSNGSSTAKFKLTDEKYPCYKKLGNFVDLDIDEAFENGKEEDPWD